MLAGKLCSPLYLSIRSETDVAPMQAGEMLNQAGVKKLLVPARSGLAPKRPFRPIRLRPTTILTFSLIAAL
jgi:hypothetical protein